MLGAFVDAPVAVDVQDGVEPSIGFHVLPIKVREFSAE